MIDVDERIATESQRRRREARRRALAKATIVGVVSVQAGLLIRGGDDPHKLFAFRPFNESDTWHAEIVRVVGDGSRRPVDDGSWIYDWDTVVGQGRVQHLDRDRHADSGARASVDFLDRALVWVLDHIPDDHDTVALQATVTVVHNTHAPEVVVLRRDRVVP
jgi:hypothetical protein